MIGKKGELIWKNEWGGNIFFSHGSSHQKGVCILVNPNNNNLSIQNSYSDEHGRIIIFNTSISNQRLEQCVQTLLSMFACFYFDGIRMARWKTTFATITDNDLHGELAINRL